jgi:D-sedoheptulose 7-phosphate isomerase
MTTVVESWVRPTTGGAERAIVEGALSSARRALARLSDDAEAATAIAVAGGLMAEVLRAGGRLLACGNGGSMCDAMHFAEELTGNFRRPRAPLAAMVLGDASHLTCVGNDFGFEEIFARGVRAFGRPGDLLLAISTSGRSANVIAAAEAARAVKIRVVALTGQRQTPLGALADIDVVTEGDGPWADRVQELHGVVLHAWIEVIEARLFGADPVAGSAGPGREGVAAAAL